MEAVSSPMASCCEFCFGILTVPCEASCGHWFCGDCILKYWSYSSPFYPCKCPTCSEKIVWLKPEASQDQGAKVADVLQKIRKYNLLFSSVFGYFVGSFYCFYILFSILADLS
jgi:RING finger protein 170